MSRSRRQTMGARTKCCAERSASARAPMVDALEPRLSMSVVTWDGGGGDNLWSSPLNWSGDVLPGPGDDVDLTAPGPVIADVESIRIRSLRLRKDFTISPGVELRVDGTMIAPGDFGSALAEFVIAGSVAIRNGTSPLSTTTLRRTSVLPGGELIVGTPASARTPAQLGILNSGLIRLHNLDPTGLLGNSPGGILELSNVDASKPIGAFGINNSGTILVDDQAGPVSIVDVNSTGNITVLGDATLRLLASSLRGSTLRADSPTSRIQLHFAGYDPLANSNQVPPTIDLTAVRFEGPGSTTIIGAANSTLRFGNTVVDSTLLIPSAAAVRVSGGRLTITGTLAQYGDDPQGDFLGAAQVRILGTLTLTGPGRLVSTPLSVGNGGRVETTGPLMLLNGPIFTAVGGTIARTTEGLTRITGPLDNRGAVDANLGRIAILGPITQLDPGTQGQSTLAAGSWIARHDAVLAWPAGTSITQIDRQASISFLGEESRIQGFNSLHTNHGTITLAGGRDDFLAGPNAPTSLRNHGTIRKVGGGMTTIGVPVEQRKLSTGAGVIEVRRGTLVLVGQEFINRGTLDVRSGRLVIDLGDEGMMVNTGSVVLAGAGRMEVEGSLDNRATGDIETEITGARAGRVIVSERLDLGAGTLRASFVGSGFEAGEFWRVVTAGERLGTFGTFTSSEVPGGLRAVPAYGEGVVRVRVVV